MGKKFDWYIRGETVASSNIMEEYKFVEFTSAIFGPWNVKSGREEEVEIMILPAIEHFATKRQTISRTIYNGETVVHQSLPWYRRVFVNYFIIGVKDV